MTESLISVRPMYLRRRGRNAGPRPVPAILLSIHGVDGGPDEISVVWSFVLNGDPPQVGVSVDHEHVAQKLLRRHREFVLNVPTAAIAEPFDRIDMSSRRTADKFALSGLTRGRAVAVDAPTVEECPIHVECRVLQEVDLPPRRRVFFAEVAATTVLEGVCDESGMLLVDRMALADGVVLL